MEPTQHHLDRAERRRLQRRRATAATRRRRKLAAAAAVLAASASVATAMPARATDPSAIGGTAPSPGQPPVHVPTSMPYTSPQRFIPTWTARFLTGGAALATTEDERKAYAGVDEATRRSLISGLIASWDADVPGFRAAMAERGPDGQLRWTYDRLRSLVYLSVFAPDQLGNGIDGVAPPAVPDLTAGAPEGVAADAAGEVAALLDERAAEVRTRAQEQLGVVEEAARDAAVPVPPLPELPPVPAAPVELLPAPGVPEVPSLPDLVDLPLPAVPDAGELVATATYVPCAKAPGQAEVCGPRIPAGVPFDLDVDRNAGTGLLGRDVRVLMGLPDPLAVPGGVGVQISAERLGGAAGAFDAYVRYDVPRGGGRLTAGFSGTTAAPLAPRQGVTVALQDVEGFARAGRVDLDVAPAHAGPAGHALAVRATWAGPATTVNGVVRIVRAPASGMHVGITREGPEAPTTVALTGTGGADVRAALQLGSTTVGAEVDRLPDAGTLVADLGRSSFDWRATAPIPRIAANVADGGLVASAEVLDLPAQIAVELGRRSFRSTATAGIRKVLGALSWGSGTAKVAVDGVPAVVAASWDGAGATYDASGPVAQITGTFSDASGFVATGEVRGLPGHLDVAFGDGAASVATGPDQQVGSVAATVRTSKQAPALAAPAGDHVALAASPAGLAASLRISGVRSAAVREQGSSGLTATLEAPGSGAFTATLATPDGRGLLEVSDLPARLDVAVQRGQATFDTGGTRIARIAGRWADGAGTDLRAEVRGLPRRATLAYGGVGAVGWDAADPVELVEVDATAPVAGVRTRAVASLLAVPATWDLAYGGGGVRFTTPGRIGSVAVGVARGPRTLAMPAGQHLDLDHRSDVDVTASLRLLGVQHASWAPGERSVAQLRAGAGQPFTSRLAAVDGAARATASLSLSALPPSIEVELGDGIEVRSGGNPDLRATAAHGTPEALADMGAVPIRPGGLVLRDGAAAGTRAFGAALDLTGLPSAVSVRGGDVAVTGFRPRHDLTVDVVLDDPVGDVQPLRAAASVGVVDATPLSLSWTSSTEGGAASRSQRHHLVTSRPLGRVALKAASGQLFGEATASNVPDDVELVTTEAEGQLQVAWRASQPVGEVTAGFLGRWLDPAEASYVLASRVRLAEVPRSVDLSVGRGDAGSGAVMAYRAAAGTLDLLASADGSLKTSSTTIGASLTFEATDLAPAVDLVPDGSGAKLTAGGGRIGRLAATASATYRHRLEGSGEVLNWGWLRVPYRYDATASAHVDRLTVVLTGAASFGFTPGITSRITGDFTAFQTAWRSAGARLQLDADLDAVIDWPSPFGTSTLELVDVHEDVATEVDVKLHVYDNVEGPWFAKRLEAFACHLQLGMDLRPKPHSTTMLSSGLDVPKPTTPAGWSVTPNPWGLVPDVGIDLLTWHQSPKKGMWVTHDVGCGWW